LTIRILRAGYVVENENRAVAMTEAPEKIDQFHAPESTLELWNNADILEEQGCVNDSQAQRPGIVGIA
jgi:hypothetical protein